MRKRGVIVCMMFCLILLVSCRGETNWDAMIKQTQEPEMQEGFIHNILSDLTSTQKELVMVYMVGSNLESESALASEDIREMLASNYDMDKVKVLVCTGGASKWWIEGVPNGTCTIFELGKNSMKSVYQMKNENMGQSETLTEFLDYGYETYPSEYYGLVLWDHGGGAVVGYGADENYNYDSLTMPELDFAFSNAKLCKKEKFEWVGFDACLMGMLEVADIVSPYAKYFIASEELEAGVGWDYQFLSEIGNGGEYDGKSTGESIIESYSEYFETTFLYKADYTLSCLDLSKIDQVNESLDRFVDAAAGDLYKGAYSKIAKARDITKSFGKVSNSSFYDTVDLYDLAEKMKPLYQEEADELQNALKEFVVCNKTNVSNANGVALYFPYENKEYSDEWLEQYEDSGFSTTYVSFVNAFHETLSGEQLTDWDIGEIAPAENEEQPGNYFVQLNEMQMQNYGRSNYSIWQEDSENSYICWLYSNDVMLSEDGKLSSDFDGRKFYIGDTSGNSVMCSAMEIERTKDYVTYVTPLILTDKNSEVKSLYVHIKVDEEHPDGVIAGLYNSMDAEASLFPDKTSIQVESGDGIAPYYFARNIVFQEDGGVAPFDTWESTSGIGSGFAVSGDLTVTMKDPGEEDYCCLFQVSDTQGNKYYTNPIFFTK